jgi:hypothetical protein
MVMPMRPLCFLRCHVVPLNPKWKILSWLKCLLRGKK